MWHIPTVTRSCKFINMGLISLFQCGHQILSDPELMKMLFPLVCIFGIFDKCFICVVLCTFMFVASIMFHFYMSVFVPVPYCFYYNSSVIYFRIWTGNPPSITLFAQDWFSISVKNAVDILIGTALSLWIAWPVSILFRAPCPPEPEEQELLLKPLTWWCFVSKAPEDHQGDLSIPNKDENDK